MRLSHLLVIASVLLLPLGASAQWQWVDKDNKKVFSDQPPPPEVPEDKILRRPAAPSRRAVPAVAATTDAAPLAPAAPPSGDKALEEKKRQAEQAEKAKQAAEADKLAKAKAENCSRAKEGKEMMDSGMRVASMNAAGERVIMDDDARAAEQKRLQGVISSDCK
jgi:hypothetical protein